MKKFSALIFYNQLLPLLRHGIALDEALHILVKNAEPHMVSLHQKIKSGADFSSALNQLPTVFTAFDCALIYAGERCGQLVYFIEKLIDYHQKRLDTRAKIKKALFYPAFVFATSIIITFALLIFIIPQFQIIFASFNTPLPLITQYVVNFSNFIQHDGILLIIFITSAAFTIKHFVKKNLIFRHRLQIIFLKTPLFGALIHNSALSLICFLLGTTQQSGLPLLNSLGFSIQATAYIELQNKLLQIKQAVEHGQLLSVAMNSAQLLDGENLALLTISEQTGQLAETLKQISQRLTEQTQRQLDLVNSLIEPIIMLVLAVVIGALIIAMYLPIFTIGAAIH